MDEDKRYWFESVPDEERYWAVVRFGLPQSQADEVDLGTAQGLRLSDSVVSYSESAKEVDEFMRRADAIDFAPVAIEPELVGTNPDKYGLVLYTSRRAAEEELRSREERDPDEYLRLKDIYGQEMTDQAYSNTPPYRVVWTATNLLLGKLEELDLAGIDVYGPPLEYVVVDGQQRDWRSFKQELERRVREWEE